MKIDDKIAQAEKKLAEVKNKHDTLKQRLNEVTKERGKLEADKLLSGNGHNKDLTQLIKDRNVTKEELEVIPVVITELERKLQQFKKEKEEGILQKNLVEQKKAAREIEKLSQDLASSLKKANSINKELQRQRSHYTELHKITKEDVFEKHTTTGSLRSLEQLTGVIIMEVEQGKRRAMLRYPPPGPAI